MIIVTIGFKCTSEVILKNAGGDDLLALLLLRVSLSVVLAKEWIICGYESDDTLFTFVANVNSDKHCLW